MMEVPKRSNRSRNKKWKNKNYFTNKIDWPIEVQQKLFYYTSVQAKVCFSLIFFRAKFNDEKFVGENNEMLQRTLQLGISLLHGGNREVQKVNEQSFASRFFEPLI